MTDPPDAPDASDPEQLTQASPATAPLKQTIGPYRLLQLVGEGGMGEVWLAEQTRPVHRQVALKVIKAGMDTGQVVARFEAERQALALMDHPAIARVFDAGATPQGRPYFVMEYVRGESITGYVTRRKLSIPDRIDLFVQICEGVQHAHQKGIIHRDLKPSNILVTLQNDRPVPKIIDFGVAKAVTHSLTERTLYTEFGALVGTPEYMSPEQTEMSSLDIDTRTDVYALGVILYELLTGALPFESQTLRAKGLDEIRRTIREVDPPRPSTKVTSSAGTASSPRMEAGRLASELRGDLDWITMKAMEKDRTRRYGSVSDLAADLKRHLDNFPVLASPPSTGYRIGKFVRRYRLTVIMTVTLLVLLLTFAGMTALQAQRTARERDRANTEAKAAKEIADFLAGLFSVSDPSQARGNTVTAREILDRGVKKIGALSNQPLVQARLERTLGGVYTSLGLYALANPLLEHALSTYRHAVGNISPESADVLFAIGEVRYYEGRFADAERAYREVAGLRRDLLGLNAKETMEAEMAVGSACMQQERFNEADQLFRSTLDRQRRVLGERDPLTLNTINEMSNMYYMQQRFADALPLAEESARMHQLIFGDDAPRTLGSHHVLASTLDKLGRFSEAEQEYWKALSGKRRVIGDRHPDTARTEVRLGTMYVALRRYADAEPLVVTAYTTLRASLGDQSPLTKSAITTAIDLYSRWGKSGAAAEWRAKLPKDAAPKP